MTQPSSNWVDYLQEMTGTPSPRKPAPRPRPTGELRNYEPSTWKDWLIDKLQSAGTAAGLDTRAGMAAMRGLGETTSALVPPIQAQHGAYHAREGYHSDNPDRMWSGIGDIAGAAATAIPFGIGSLAKGQPRGAIAEYRAAHTAPKAERDIYSPENMAKGRDRPYQPEPTGNATVDHQTRLINDSRKAEGLQPVRPEEIREAMEHMSPLQKALVAGGMGSGRSPWLQPGHLALQAGNVAGVDWLWNAGMMPWSWNEPGTLQHEGREIFGSPTHVSGRKTPIYPPEFPRMELTPEQLQERWASGYHPHDGRGPNPLISNFLSGRPTDERTSYASWLASARELGRDLHSNDSDKQVLTRQRPNEIAARKRLHSRTGADGEDR